MTMDPNPENVNGAAGNNPPPTAVATAGYAGLTVTNLPYALWAGKLITNGYSPVATRKDNSKAPIEDDWTEYVHELKVRGSIYKRGNRRDFEPFDGYLGVACGVNGLIAIDIDVDDWGKVYNEHIRVILAKVSGDTHKNYLSPVQKKGAHGRTLYYRIEGTEEELAELTKLQAIKSHNVRNPDFDTGKRGDPEYSEPEYIFEIKWKGTHTTIPPSIHPKTGKEYVWCGDKDEYGEFKSLFNTRIDQLPVLSMEQAKALCAYNSAPRHNMSKAISKLSKVIDDIPVEYEGLKCRDIVFNEIIRPLVFAIPPNLIHGEWLNVGFALAKMFGADDGQARELFIDWSRQDNNRWVGTKTPEYTWDSIKDRDDDHSVGFGTIIEYARREGYEHLLWHDLYRIKSKEVIENIPINEERKEAIATRQHIYSNGFIVRCALIRRFFKPQWSVLRFVLKEYRGKADKKCCNINEFEQLVAMVALPGAEDINDKQTAIDKLLELAKREFGFFQTSDRRAIAVCGNENFFIRSQAFRIYLRGRCSEQGLVLSRETLNTGLEELESIARMSDTISVKTRVARDKGKHYIDLCDKERRIVEIDKDGWRVIDKCPVVFIRRDGMKAVALPEVGKLSEGLEHLKWLLREKANPSGFVLGISWLLCSMQEAREYMNLGVFGGSSNAKSSYCFFLRDLIDPHELDMRSPSKNQRDMWIAFNQQHIYLLDNVSAKRALSDDDQTALSKVNTGGGRGDKTNYTDEDETVFKAIKPTIVNGINNCITNEDLHSRTVYVEIPPFMTGERIEKEEVYERHERNKGMALGALLDIFVYGLKKLEETEPENGLRMMGFSRFAKACEGAYCEIGSFSKYFKDGSMGAAIDLLMGEFTFEVLMRTLIQGFNASQKEFKWEGYVGELLALMDKYLSDKFIKIGTRKYPKAPNALSRWLRDYMTAMNKTDWCEIEMPPRDNKGAKVELTLKRGCVEVFEKWDIVPF